MKYQDKTTGRRKDLFCVQCGYCMYTKEDIQSRDLHGVCRLCTKGQYTENRNDVVRIVIDDDY